MVAKENIVYLDESGIDNRIHGEYGRSPRGQKLFVEVPGSRKQRVSIIAASCQNQVLAPFIFEGSCNTAVFNAWVEKELAPELKEGQVVVMDNASFHKSACTVELIERAGCRVLFLPPYSPDYNPIEHYWHQLKSAVRRLLPKCKDVASAIEAFFNPILTPT